MKNIKYFAVKNNNKSMMMDLSARNTEKINGKRTKSEKMANFRLNNVSKKKS